MGIKKSIVFNILGVVIVISTCLIAILLLDGKEPYSRFYNLMLNICIVILIVSLIFNTIIYKFYSLRFIEIIDKLCFKSNIELFRNLNVMIVVFYFPMMMIDQFCFNRGNVEFIEIFGLFIVTFLLGNFFTSLSIYKLTFKDNHHDVNTIQFISKIFCSLWHLMWIILFLGLFYLLMSNDYPFSSIIVINMVLFQINFIIVRVRFSQQNLKNRAIN